MTVLAACQIRQRNRMATDMGLVSNQLVQVPSGMYNLLSICLFVSFWISIPYCTTSTGIRAVNACKNLQDMLLDVDQWQWLMKKVEPKTGHHHLSTNTFTSSANVMLLNSLYQEKLSMIVVLELLAMEIVLRSTYCNSHYIRVSLGVQW